MSTATGKSPLSDLIAEAERVKSEACAAFGSLSPVQINWKRSMEEWSIGQCFDHLITANRAYFPLLERIAAGEQKQTLWQRVPLVPGLFGRLLIGAVNPESARKLKAPRAFKPSSSDVAPDIINQFAQQQDELVRLMKATERLRPEKLIIPSPVSSLVTYSLMDGYRILVVHERRHFKQAERVMQAEGFPPEV